MIDFGKARPTWFEIDLSALEYNIRNIKNKVKDTKVIGVVKANAYSHGANMISPVLLKNGADLLAVAATQEAVILRDIGISAPILVLGPIFPYEAQTIVAYDISPTITSLSVLSSLEEWGKKLNKIINIHIKIDTGMGRIGFLPDNLESVINEIKKYPHINVYGVFSHFSSSAEDRAYTLLQIERFEKAKSILDKVFNVEIYHIANSAGVLYYPEAYFDGVRPGTILYGYFPGDGKESEVLNLKKVLRFKTKVSFIKEVPEHTYVGYSRTFITKRKTKIATLPVGYADGYHRFLSNKGKVIVNGEYAPIIGRVCMDQTMIDVTDIPKIEIGDEVVLLGEQKGKTVWVTQWSELTGASVPQLFVDLDKNRPVKVYRKDGNIEKIVYPV